MKLQQILVVLNDGETHSSLKGCTLLITEELSCKAPKDYHPELTQEVSLQEIVRAWIIYKDIRTVHLEKLSEEG